MNRFVWAGRAGLLWMALAIGTPALAAEPTLNQVYEAVHAGRLNQAHGMMTEVLRDHPNSAKAHYVEAEILAKEGRYGEAQGELYHLADDPTEKTNLWLQKPDVVKRLNELLEKYKSKGRSRPRATASAK